VAIVHPKLQRVCYPPLYLKAFVLRLEHCDINSNSTTTAERMAWFSNVVFVGITSPVQLNSTENRLYVTILLSSLEYSCFPCETFKRYCFSFEKQLKHHDSPHVTGGVGRISFMDVEECL